MKQAALTESSSTAEELYGAVVQDMHRLYDYRITEADACDAASNLIGFCKTLLEIKMEAG